MISIIRSSVLSQYLIATKEIFNIGRDRLKEMLSCPKEQSEALLDIVFERSYKFYLDYLNRIQR